MLPSENPDQYRHASLRGAEYSHTSPQYPGPQSQVPLFHPEDAAPRSAPQHGLSAVWTYGTAPDPHAVIACIAGQHLACSTLATKLGHSSALLPDTGDWFDPPRYI